MECENKCNKCKKEIVHNCTLEQHKKSEHDQQTRPVRNVKTIKRSNKAGQALDLPACMNINPRSVYNKPEELTAMILEEDVDCTFLSETWERPNYNLQQLLPDLLEDFEFITNPHARPSSRQGGRPAIIIKRGKYNIKNLTNTVVNIPWMVEATWASITPKNVTQDSIIKRIILCSFYYPGPHSKVKTLLLDHISQTFHLLTAKYGDGVHFTFGADANKLDLTSILTLSPTMRQLVVAPTRGEAILDPIISTLGLWYQVPICLPPLQADPGSGGATADHKITIMRPINMMNNKPARATRQIKVRPLPESILNLIKTALQVHSWNNVYTAATSHEKAWIFHKEVMEIVNQIAPERYRNISTDDQPWYTEQLKILDRKRRREFNQNRRSDRYNRIQNEYKTKCSQAKKAFFRGMVRQVKEANPGQWYSLLKRITKYDSEKQDELQIAEINHLTDAEQAEMIAEHFNATSLEYEPIKTEDLDIPDIDPETIPSFNPTKIKEFLDKIKINKATIPGDIPARIVRNSSSILCVPIAHMINHSIKSGCWPDQYKEELITPIGKVLPCELLEQLRPISNLPILNKIQEAVVAEMVISDMKAKLDPTQYGNQKKTSIQHYLVSMLNRIVTNVDNNSKGEIRAVLMLFIDWKSAFSKQCHTLGIKSFIQNGVRPALIPLLISYFQNRKIKVKFHGKISQQRNQPGSGAQGATLGNQEFLSQTNNNADCVPEDDRFKFVDDLTTLEILNLINVGLSSYNFQNHVASDIAIGSHFVENDHLKSQEYLNVINTWTENQKMEISAKKTKAMFINFTDNYQCTTRLQLHNMNVEVVDQMKILGTIITSKLTWDENCKYLIQRVNKRMLLLKKVQQFGATQDEMVHLWIMYCRSVLEQSSVVWSSSLTEENKNDIERTQKVFAKLVMKNRYNTYENALLHLNLQTLTERRNELSLKFAKNSTKHEKMKHIFPENKTHVIKTRQHEKYKVNHANTNRMKHSSVISMQHMLNQDHMKNEDTKSHDKIT